MNCCGTAYLGDLRETAITVSHYLASTLGWISSKVKPFELHDTSGAIVATMMRRIDVADQVDTEESEIFTKGQAIVLSTARLGRGVGWSIADEYESSSRDVRESLFSAMPEPLLIPGE